MIPGANRVGKAWNHPMGGVKHPSGCWNVQRFNTFEAPRMKIRPAFLQHKQMRGSGPLPEHVTVLKSNEKYLEIKLEQMVPSLKDLKSGSTVG